MWAITGSSKHGPVADVNVTPLIDVLLVLLIIFMVITPLAPKGLEAFAPPPPGRPLANPPDPDPKAIVVSLDGQRQITINRSLVRMSELGPRLEAIFETRSRRVIFVRADPNADFGDVAAIIDIAKGAGIDNIGLITKAIEPGS